VTHQRFVGTGYFDEIAQVVSGATSTTALAGSTEAAQFHAGDNARAAHVTMESGSQAAWNSLFNFISSERRKRGLTKASFCSFRLDSCSKRQIRQLEPLGFGAWLVSALAAGPISRSYFSPVKKICASDWLPSCAGFSA
jgi:hypothetical protein